MSKIDFYLQYYLITNVNESTIKNCLFQLLKIEIETKIISKFLFNKKIIMFFF